MSMGHTGGVTTAKVIFAAVLLPIGLALVPLVLLGLVLLWIGSAGSLDEALS